MTLETRVKKKSNLDPSVMLCLPKSGWNLEMEVKVCLVLYTIDIKITEEEKDLRRYKKNIENMS